jgi:hypothetical protein
MTLLEEIIFAITAAEKLIPALVSFVDTIHPPTTSAPTKADAVLTATSNALQIAGVTAQTIAAVMPTLQAAVSIATTTPKAAPAVVQPAIVDPVPN